MVDLVEDGAVEEEAGLVLVVGGEVAGGLGGAATDGTLGREVAAGLAGAATDGAAEDAGGGFVGRFLTSTVFGGAAPPNWTCAGTGGYRKSGVGWSRPTGLSGRGPPATSPWRYSPGTRPAPQAAH